MSTPPHDKLASWLDEASAGASVDPPAELESDVVEAVLALRPDLAPAPRVTIDDILADLSEGPLARSDAEKAAEAHAASALAAFLASDAGPALDENASEALFALRPDLAPAPRVTIDDILDAVEEGPLSTPADNVIPLATAQRAAQPTADAPPPQAQTRPWWTLPGLGLLAAAAAAMLVVLPIGTNNMAPLDLAQDQRRYEAVSAPAPSSASPPPPPAADVISEDQSVSTRGVPAVVEPLATTIGADAAPSRDNEVQQERLDAAAPEQQALRNDTPQEKAEAAPYPSLGSATAPASAVRSAPAPVPELEPEPEPESIPEPAPLLEAVDSTASTAGGAAGGVDFSSSSRTQRQAEPGLRTDNMIDDADVDAFGSAGRAESSAGVQAVPSADEAERRSGRSRLGWLRESADAPVATKDAVSFDEAPPAEEKMEEEADADTAPTMSELRQAAARRFASVPNVTEDRPELAAAYQAVELLTQQQKYAEALGELEPFRRSGSPDVLLDVAWHRSNLHWQMGQTAAALEEGDEGLQAIGGDPRLRARLLYLKGQLLEAVGDVTGASAAYREVTTP